jgi:hypothetical protein
MNITEHNKHLFDEEELMDTLKKFLNKLLSISNLFKSNTAPIIINKNHESNKQDSYDIYKQNIIKTMNNIANILSEDPLFKEDEFYDFMNIQTITEDVLETKKEENIILIYELINKFIDIYELKINQNDEYNNQYNQFKTFLLKSKKKFYTKIYIPIGQHEQTINNIYDIMKQDFIKE